MEKMADTQYPIHELLKARWSPRAFSARPVEGDKLAALFEAARWAPSGGNAQPWAFVVVTPDETEAHRGLLGALSGRNPAWAANAPVLVLAAARLYPPSDPRNRYAYYDAGQAVAHLTLQASALGLNVHQMGGFDANAACAAVGMPDGYVPMTCPKTYEREMAPRTRKPLAEFVFRGRWDQPFVP